MIDKKIGENETKDLKNISKHYLDKRSDILKITQFKVEDVLVDILFIKKYY